MAGGRRRGRGILIVLISALVLVVLLWIGYWYAARSLAFYAVARLTAPHAGGETLACTDFTVGGFPLYLDVRCDRSTFAGTNQSVMAAIGGVAASAPLFRPGHVEARIEAPFVANVPARGLALTANWSEATATATAGLGGLEAFRVALASLTASNAGGGALPAGGASAESASIGFAPTTGNSLALSGSATKLVVKLADGRQLPSVDAEAKVTALDLGASLGRNPPRTLLNWARKGGALQIDQLKVSAAGALVILSGKLSLSSDGKLNGSLLIRYNSIDDLANLIEAIRPGTRDHYAKALKALNSVTIPADTPDGPVRQTTVSFIEGSVWLGLVPLPVDPIPPVHL